MDDFSDEIALEAGHWDRRYARVLAKVVVGRFAVVIFDTNGADGGLIYEDIETFGWDETSGWQAGGGSGGLGAGWTSGIAYASGEAEPTKSIVVEFRGKRHDVEVQTNGYWLFAAASDADEDEFPMRVL